MPRIPPIYKAMVAEHRARFNRVVVAQPARLKKLYDQAQGRVVKRLASTIKAGRAETFTAHVQRQMLGQLQVGQRMVMGQLRDGVADLSDQAQTEALRGVIGDIGRLEQYYTGTTPVLPIEEASRFYGIIDKNRTSLLAMHEESMANYGGRLVGLMQEDLALGLMTGESIGDVMDRITERIDGEWWQGERIVRTELAWAYNAGHSDAISGAREAVPDIMQRWVEYVDDATGQPLDDRVGVDSLAMHGQVAPPEGEFTMPAASQVPDKHGKTAVAPSLVGRRWKYPPNRPNDRATLAPWKKDWGVPGWRMSGGERVDLATSA